MALGDFLGGMGVAAQGFQDGRERVMDLDNKQDSNSYDKAVRQAGRGLLPLQTEQKRTQLQSQIDEQKHKDSLAPTRRGIETQVMGAEAELTPGKIELAKGEQKIALNTQAAALIDGVFKKELTVDQAEDGLLTMLGESLSTGDTGGALRTFKVLQQAIPGYTEIPEIKSGRMVKHKGADGKELDGVEVTFVDGRTAVLDPTRPISLYQKKLRDKDIAGAKMIKPGEEWRTPSGRLLAEGKDRPFSGTMVQDDDGNWINMRQGGAAGTGGTGSRTGKAPATPESNALTAFENIYKNSNTKLESNQLADGQDYTVRAMRQGAETPEVAARIALDAVTNPTRIQPDLNAATGEWSGVYRNPSIQGGRAFELSPGLTTADQLAKEKGGEAVVRDGVSKMLDAQGSLIAPGNPQAQAAARELFIKAAHDPATRKQMEEVAEQRGGATELSNLRRKLDMIKAYGPKPTTEKKPASSGSSSPASAPYKAPPDSPAGRAIARQDAQRQDTERQQAEAAARRDEFSAQFQADVKSMQPLELVRKYDTQRRNLPRGDAIQLLQIEQQIR